VLHAVVIALLRIPLRKTEMRAQLLLWQLDSIWSAVYTPVTHIADFSTHGIPTSAPLNIELNSGHLYLRSPVKINGTV